MPASQPPAEQPKPHTPGPWQAGERNIESGALDHALGYAGDIPTIGAEAQRHFMAALAKLRGEGR
jgi:hypothetical protein